jgi:hypothetical protein
LGSRATEDEGKDDDDEEEEDDDDDDIPTRNSI